jgi:AcrR family transcriptional regulator
MHPSPLKQSFQCETIEVTEPAPAPSRRDELLERSYHYATRNGLVDLSLRPLAAAIGSSPRVLLFLFGSKDELVRALLTRARQDELELLDRIRDDVAPADLPTTVRHLWRWLAEPAHQPLLTLWLEAYAQSLHQPDGPWEDFARQTVDDWLDLLARAQPPARRRTKAGLAERTLALAILRGALIDLLATGDRDRTTTAVEHHLRSAA